MEVSQQPSLTIKKGKYTLTGLVINEAGDPAVGVKVHAVDRDQIGKHDHLGYAVTNKEGAFKIIFKRSDFADLFEGKGPDLYFRVYKDGKIILDTEFETIEEADENLPPIILKIDFDMPPMVLPANEAAADPPITDRISWVKVPGVAQYKAASWKNEVCRKQGISSEEAKAFALAKPGVTYFIHFKQPVFLEGKTGADGFTEKGQFFANDAVFFSGKPQYGATGHADAYEKRKVVWKKKTNVAQYGGGDWTHEYMRLSNTPLATAKIIAANIPEITFFFQTRSTMWLQGKDGPGGWTEKGHFHKGDTVFFTGKPHYGSAPQADAYEKQAEPLW